jgi:hypothetical protein
MEDQQMRASVRGAKAAARPRRTALKSLLLGIGGLGFLVFAAREVPALIREIKIGMM